MKNWTKVQISTCIILFVLLFSRLLLADVVLNFMQLFNVTPLPASLALDIKLTQDRIYYFVFSWAYVLIGITIIINHTDLQSLNIDPNFIAIFSAGSLTYWVYYQHISRWLALLILLTMFILYKKRFFWFAKADLAAGKIILIVVIGFILGLFFEHNFVTTERVLSTTHFIATQIPLILVEEVIFRGLLWKFLATLEWSISKTIGLQAFLFWLSHARYMFTNPIIFWVIIPASSIILGVVAWRSKSISVSLMSHIFINFLFVLYFI